MRSSYTRSLEGVGAVDAKTGEVLSPTDLDVRVRYLLDLVHDLSTRLTASLWSDDLLRVLAADVDGAGNRLPKRADDKAHVLNWWLSPEELGDLRVDSRVRELAAANAVLGLTPEATGNALLAAVLPVLADPKVPTGALAAVPAETSRVTVRRMAKRVRRYEEREGRLPTSVVDLADPPAMPRKVNLGFVNKQLASRVYDPAGGDLTLRVKLPRVARPRSVADYGFVLVTLPLPENLRGRPITGFSLPSIRAARSGALLVDVPYDEEVPTLREDHDVALGVDWGLNTLLTGAVVRRVEGESHLETDGSGYEFDGFGLVEKSLRLQDHSQLLHAKAARIGRLLSNRPDPALEAKRDLLLAEAERVNERRRNLHRDLAFLAAREFVALARATRASAIGVEDLADLEPNVGRAMNRRISQSIRGRLVSAIRHTGERHGVAVVTVPARDSSRRCPGCDDPLERPTYSVSRCRRCSILTGRDVTAAQKLASRALSRRARRRRGSNELRIDRPDFVPVRKTREKLGPTPRRPIAATAKPRRVPRTPRITAHTNTSARVVRKPSVVLPSRGGQGGTNPSSESCVAPAVAGTSSSG